MKKVEITIYDMDTNSANNKARIAETIVNSLTPAALAILAEKAKKPGMSEKLIKYQNYI